MKPEVVVSGQVSPGGHGLSLSEVSLLGYHFLVSGLLFGVGLVLGGQLQLTCDLSLLLTSSVWHLAKQTPNWWLSLSVGSSMYDMERECCKYTEHIKKCGKIQKNNKSICLMSSRRELGRNKNRYVGRPVQELRGEDKKFQPVAEAKRRCIWGADSSKQMSLSNDHVHHQKSLNQNDLNKATDKPLRKLPLPLEEARRVFTLHPHLFTLSPMRLLHGFLLKLVTEERAKCCLPSSCRNDKPAVA